MTKTLFLVLVILVVGFFVIAAIMAFIKHAERLEDEDHQERRGATRDLREARDDFRYDQEVARRMADLDKPKKGKK